MEWEADVSAGSWIADRLDGDYETIHGVIPRGFAAYARIFHAPDVRSVPGGRVPTQREVERMTPAQLDELMERTVDESTTWAETASAFGTVMHPLAQWASLTRTSAENPSSQAMSQDGREFSSPSGGECAAELTSAVVSSLTNGATPVTGHSALWAGTGGLLGGYGTSGRQFFTLDETGTDADPEVAHRHAAMLAASTRDPFNNVFQQPAWEDGILPRSASEGVKLELPGRSHVVFSGDLSVFSTPEWILDVPWRDLPAEAHGFTPHAQTPSLMWPADHSWIVVTEVDFDTTLVGGSRETIDRLLRHPGIEALEIPEGASLQWDADQLNR